MLVEGLHLYLKVVQVFKTENVKMLYYYIFGWGKFHFNFEGYSGKRGSAERKIRSGGGKNDLPHPPSLEKYMDSSSPNSCIKIPLQVLIKINKYSLGLTFAACETFYLLITFIVKYSHLHQPADKYCML